MKTTSIVNNDFNLKTLAHKAVFYYADLQTDKLKPFENNLTQFLNTKYCYFTSCGFTALYVILKSLKELKPDKTEVIIPAYTAPGLILPIKYLGLTVKLCDISLKTFNIDIDKLKNSLTSKTLAVIPVHMFGICVNISEIRQICGNDIFVIEDAAQSLGSEFQNKKAGSLSNIGFGSFGRGKNFSLYHGGFLTFNSDEFYEVIEKNYWLLPRTSKIRQIKNVIKFLLFSTITQPSIYYFFRKCLASIKSKKEQSEFDMMRMGDLTKSFGSSLFDVWLKSYNIRIENGIKLFDMLKTIQGIQLPYFDNSTKTAFNRFPILFDDINIKYKIFSKLIENGIESSFMYGKAVHNIWNLGYKNEDLPNAAYFADHLLTLPAHGYSADINLNIIYEIFKEVASHDSFKKF